MRLLVLTTELISAARLREALPGEVDPTDAEVMVLAPALHESALRFWMSDADDAIAKAEAVRRQTVENLSAEGVPASGDTGEADPVQAIQDALHSFAADRMIVFTHAGADRRYLEDLDTAEIEERFGVPVERALVSS